MKYSLRALKDYVRGDFTLQNLQNWLAMLGLNPVVTADADDVFIEIEVPANRGDLLSAIGIIKAVAPYGEIEPLYPEKEVKEEIENPVPVEIESFDDCTFYAGRVIEDVVVGPSPEWLKKRVISAGFRSVNNVVDITNLVLWELGHPLHAFDLDLIKEKIIVRRASNGEKITTIDNEKRTLSSEVLVIADIEKPVAIAGIMGGLDTEVSERTRNVFVESALFSASRIRRGSKFLGLATDASARFEKQADASLVIPSLDRCCSLIQKICGGKISCISSAGSNPGRRITISVNRKKINAYLGCKIPEEFSIKVLQKLGFSVSVNNENLIVEIGEGRKDIERDVDIIEEIAKYYGYDSIPEKMPFASISSTPSSPDYVRLDNLKNFLINLNFSEVINHGLSDKNELDFSSGLPVEIVNPLSQNYSMLRTSLIPGILKNLRDNHNVKVEKMSIFEIGNIYCMKNSQPFEQPAVCLAVSNICDFFAFKGNVEAVFNEIGYHNLSQKIVVSDEGTIINFLNQVCTVQGYIVLPSQNILKKYDLENQEVFVAEIFLSEFVTKGFPQTHYTALPKILPVTRDLSLVVPDSVNWKYVEEFLYKNLDILQNIEVFDIYKGRNIPEGNTSVSITLTLSNIEGNLTREKADEIMKDLICKLERQFSITIRK